MRLKSIELHDDFRSLKSGFRLDFIKELPSNDSAIEPYCIVGRNGSGKSNILELLSAIFYQVEVSCLNFLPKDKTMEKDKEVYKELEIFQALSPKSSTYDVTDEKRSEAFDNFTSDLRHTIKPTAYKLEYYMENENLEVVLVTIKREKEGIIELRVNGEHIKGNDVIKSFLPSYIVGYSSGQNEILSLPFYKMRLVQHDEYLDDYLAKDIKFETPESRMVYLDDAFSQAIFITNFIYTDTKVDEVFKNTIGVESVESFRIVIKDDIDTRVVVEVKEKGKEGTQLKERSRFLKEQISEQLEKLKSCATMQYKNKETKELYLDYYLDDTVKEVFQLEFGKGKEGRLNLFQTFQTLINLNYYHIKKETKLKLYDTSSLYAKGYLPQSPWNERFFGFKYFNLKKVGIKDTVLSKSLSDGEYQFLHSIGLALIYRDTQSLFLLDEPETHFNPSWRAEYMSVLKECFSGIKTKAEFLITSHSPFIVSDTKESNVILFEKDEKKGVRRKDIHIKTFGASVDEITDIVFNQQGTIGNLSLKELNDSISNIETMEDYHNAKMILNKLGDSVEKFDAYNYLNKKKKDLK